MEYLSLVIVLAGALVAVRGDTWSESGITRWGYLTISIASIGFITAIFLTYQSDIDNTKKELMLESLETSSREAADKARDLEAELAIYHNKVGQYQAKLETYQSIISDIKSYSERQEQIVMIQAVTIPPGGNWRAPNKVFSGSKIEPYFFKGNQLEIKYQGRTQKLRRGRDDWAKLFIIGNSGQEFQWLVHNPTDQIFEGKIEVLSTPRSRSRDWSWLEEKLTGVNGG